MATYGEKIGDSTLLEGVSDNDKVICVRAFELVWPLNIVIIISIS